MKITEENHVIKEENYSGGKSDRIKKIRGRAREKQRYVSLNLRGGTHGQKYK